MPLPRGDEYNLAVQHPQDAFSDNDLRACRVEETPLLGLPKPYSGGFTTTYKLIGRPQNWAVRCFTRAVPDLQRRYEAIGRFKAGVTSAYFVPATCLPKGIHIGSDWHAIIKMAWVDGNPLNVYLGANLIPVTTKKLSDEFKSLVTFLQANGIAHGDLQHGNIIVRGDKLVLVDYDGVYLPELSGLTPSEFGHVNYQHPRRTPSDYSPTIDRFSSIVIYLGLIALSQDPSLWRRYDNSENILFRQQDFLDVNNSVLLEDLASHALLAALVERFKYVCNLDIGHVPTLEQFIDGTFSMLMVQAPVVQAPVVRHQYPIVDAKDLALLRSYQYQRIEVVGQLTDHYIGRDKYGKFYFFLNFGRYPNQTFTLVLWASSLTSFDNQNLDPIHFVDQWVAVTGIVSTYRNKPQMSIELPAQIQLLGDENGAKNRLKGITAPPSAKPMSAQTNWVGAQQSIATIPSAITTNSKSPLTTDISSREINTLNKLYGGTSNVVRPGASSNTVATSGQAAISQGTAATFNKLYGAGGPITPPVAAGPPQTTSPHAPSLSSSPFTSQPSGLMSPAVPSGSSAALAAAQARRTRIGLAAARVMRSPFGIKLLIGCILVVLVVAWLFSNPTTPPHEAVASPTVPVAMASATIESMLSTVEPQSTAAPTNALPSAPPLPSASVLPATSSVNSGVVTKTSKAANLRSGPGSVYDVVKTLNPGTSVVVIERTSDNSWFHVTLTQTVKGWLRDSTLEDTTQLTNLPVAAIIPPSPTTLPIRLAPAGSTPTIPPTLKSNLLLVNSILVVCVPEGQVSQRGSFSYYS